MEGLDLENHERNALISIYLLYALRIVNGLVPQHLFSPPPLKI